MVHRSESACDEIGARYREQRQSADTQVPVHRRARSTGSAEPSGALSALTRQSARSKASNTSARPFAELCLSDKQIREAAEQIRSNAYAAVDMTPATKTFLHKERASQAGWRNKFFDWDEKDLSETADARAVTDTATRLVAALEQPSKRSDRTRTLHPQEFQIRRWKEEAGAKTWHQDSGPKKLGCIAALNGAGTEFVAADIGLNLFTGHALGTHMEPKQDIDVNGHIKRTEPGRFYWFAARGLKAPDVPKWVHRSPASADTSPDDPERAIFMARWRSSV